MNFNKIKSLIAKSKHRGIFTLECIRDGNLIWSETFSNLTVDEGLNDILDVYFAAGSQSATWYVGLIGSNSTPLAGWDAAGIGVDFTEFEDYSELVRETWTVGAVSGKSISNTASPAEFNIDDSGTVYGAFIINENTKGGTTGVLWCASLLASSRPVVSGDIVRATYTVTSADA